MVSEQRHFETARAEISGNGADPQRCLDSVKVDTKDLKTDFRDDAIRNRVWDQRNQDNGVDIVPAGNIAEGMHAFTQVLMPLPMEAGYQDRAIGGDGSDRLNCGAQGHGRSSSGRVTKGVKRQFC